MDYQTLTAPDGSQMVVLSRADFDRLVSMAEDDARDIRAADRAGADPVRYPAAVVDAILDGVSPVAAWRTYRRMTQAELAGRAGIGQTGIARLETKRNGRYGRGRVETRSAIAAALDIPIEALDPVDD